MKLISPAAAITVLAALALAGCNQNSPGNSTETPATNTSSSVSGVMMNGTNNIMPTNNISGLNTNMPAGTNQ